MIDKIFYFRSVKIETLIHVSNGHTSRDRLKIDVSRLIIARFFRERYISDTIQLRYY